MSFELPEVKRCCCFLPLRYGLLIWGCIRLVIAILLFILFMFPFVKEIELINYRENYNIVTDIIVLSIILLMLAVEIGFSCVLLIGGYEKSARLLRVFYVYSIVILVLNTLIFTTNISMALYLAAKESSDDTFSEVSIQLGYYFQSRLLLAIVYLGLLVYFITALRSELRKPRYKHDFQFTNTAAEFQRALDNETKE